MSFESTGWKIAGSSGGTVKVGTPIVNVEVGASYIRLPITNIADNTDVMLQGGGIGVGAGLSISTPLATGSFSLDQFPSGGIGTIVKGPAAPGTFQASDFSGEILVFSLSAGKQVSGQLAGVLWLKDSIVSCIAQLDCSKESLNDILKAAFLKTLSRTPAFSIPAQAYAIYQRTKAAGSFTAMNIDTQLIGAGVDLFGYRVS